LTIYTSGGTEKVPDNSAVTRRAKAGFSEAVIKRNEDGSVSVVYPDSDEEEIHPQLQPETDVIKGHFS
jgi:hypothetical protein